MLIQRGMFPAGTKVRVCYSTVTGKKLGPKRNSVGFVSHAKMIQFVDQLENFPIKNQSFVLFLLKIIFTRYGNELKSRSEVREFVQILPVFKKKINRNDVKKVIEILQGKELTKNSSWSKIWPSYKLGTVIPINSEQVSHMDFNEFKSWLLSLLMNPGFATSLIKNRNILTLNNTMNPDLIIWLSNAARDPIPRIDLLKWAKSDSENVVSLINTMRILNSIIFSKNSLKNIKDINQTSSLEHKLLFFTNDLFSNENLINAKLDSINTLNLGKSLHHIIENLRLVRSTYLNLKI